MSHGAKSISWEVIVSVILSKKLCMYMCPIPNSFQIGLFHYTVPKLLIRKILRTVSNTGIYCSSNKIPPSTSMNFATRVRTWRVARLYSVQCTVYCTVK
jgi:hypothetical protein